MTKYFILVPTDFSQDATSALQYASILAQALAQPMVIVHVKPASVLPHAADDVDDPAESAAHKRLMELRPGAPGTACEHRLLRGNPPDEILRIVDEHHVNLIVMGTHGTTNSPQQPIGSISAAVLKRSKVPVICVRQGSQP